MKKLISYFIKYPISGWIIILAFFIMGVLGYLNMKSSFFPQTRTKFISINAFYPGASPQEIEEGVVLLIENNLKGTVGIDRITSTSSENSANIMVEVEKGNDVNIVLAEVKNAVDRVPNFPAGMEPPVVAKIESIAESISFVVSGENVSLKTLKDLVRDIETDLLRMRGISQVTLSGFPDEEIEISVSEDDLRAYQISFQEVATAVRKANLISSGGSIKTDAEEYLIRARNRLYTADELDNLIIRTEPNGNSIRIKDVAVVVDRFNETPNASYYNGNPSVRVQVDNTNSEDLISTSEKVKEYIEDFNSKHSSVQIYVTRDSSITLTQRTELLAENAIVGMLLVFVFLALFLKPRLAFWVAFGLPFSFLGMFIFAGSFGVTINVLSLFGMIIVIGILVDDGIVIAENIYSEFEKGKSPIKAAIDGTMQVIPPIISAITTTILAFSIFFFLDGNIGEFFGEVATVVSLVLAISLLEALVILPSHIAHSKALTPKQKMFGFNKTAEKFMNFLRDKFYSPVLDFFMQNVYTRIFGLIFPIVLLMITVGGFQGGVIKGTFFPSIASDRVQISLKMPQGTNEKITDSIATKIEEAIWKVNVDFTERQTNNDTVVLNVIKRIGPGSASASVNVNLLQGELRDFSADEIANAIQEEVGPIYGAETVSFGSGTGFGGRAVSVSLLSNNIAELKLAKTELKNELLKNPMLKDVNDTDPEGIKEIQLKLKSSAYLLGLTLNDVISQVRSGFFGLEAQRFQRGQDEIKVWVRYNREERSSIKNLDNMLIQTPSGDRVALSEIATYEMGRGEISINHLDGQREIRVEADMKNRKESATAILDDIKTRIMPEINAKYPSVNALYEGQNREATKVSESASKVGWIVLLLIYVVIAFTFRSFSQPIMLLLMVPFSMVGVAWGHYIHGFPVNILSMLGIIALIGIIVNDGLVLITKFNNYLKEGMKYDEALTAAGKSRFRAIFLTSLTTVAGLAPLIFETSRQAQFLIPMAIAIAYGIAFATMLTLLTLPILLKFSNDFKVLTKWFWTGKKPSREQVERAVKELVVENEDLDNE
ncbi:MAG: RND transporter [Bacteroidetes bacterium MedPE-SWsnd-G1]|mgnify:CR=1 FL=1|nr:MAG: RND transporter [Bacteroidetes bacterium MedPE-SWsnd-G1]